MEIFIRFEYTPEAAALLSHEGDGSDDTQWETGWPIPNVGDHVMHFKSGGTGVKLAVVERLFDISSEGGITLTLAPAA